MSAATGKSHPGAGRAVAPPGRVAAWGVAAIFLTLGIGGALVSWSRYTAGAGTEQVLSGLAIATVGILAAIVHGRALIALKSAEQTEVEIEREHIATRLALEQAAAVPPLRQPLQSDGGIGPGLRGSRRQADELLSWQLEQVADNIEADAALIRDLKRAHGPAKLAKAWERSCSPRTSDAVAELAELVPPRKR